MREANTFRMRLLFPMIEISLSHMNVVDVNRAIALPFFSARAPSTKGPDRSSGFFVSVSTLPFEMSLA